MSESKIMIVEDSPTVKYQVRLILENTGIKLVEAGGKIGMYNQIEEYGKLVDLILMDLTLKEENGFDLIRELKSNNKYKDIGILVLTEKADMNSVLKAKELGVDGYIVKPIRKENFIDKVMNALADSISRRVSSNVLD